MRREIRRWAPTTRLTGRDPRDACDICCRGSECVSSEGRREPSERLLDRISIFERAMGDIRGCVCARQRGREEAPETRSAKAIAFEFDAPRSFAKRGRKRAAQARLLARFDSPISSQISAPDISQKKTKKRTRRGPPSRGPSSSLLHWQQSLVPPPDSRIRVVFARLPPPRVHTRSPGSRAGFFFVSWHLEKKNGVFFCFLGCFCAFGFFCCCSRVSAKFFLVFFSALA